MNPGRYSPLKAAVGRATKFGWHEHREWSVKTKRQSIPRYEFNPPCQIAHFDSEGRRITADQFGDMLKPQSPLAEFFHALFHEREVTDAA